MPTASTSQILRNNECFEPYTSNIYNRPVLRIVWEIKQRVIVDVAVDRGCFIDRSQSLNIHMVQPNFQKLTSMHFHAWQKGLKTGMYYLRSRAAADPIKFTVDASLIKDKAVGDSSRMVRSLTNRDECLACGS